jgi:hypothetical protein
MDLCVFRHFGSTVSICPAIDSNLRDCILRVLFESSEPRVRQLVLCPYEYDVFWLDVGMPT